MAAPISLVTLPGLDGNAVVINPAQVCALTPVPANLLPTPAPPAATYVDMVAGEPLRVAVIGSTAAIAALISGGAPAGTIVAIVKMSDGTILAQNAAAAAAGLTATNTAPGHCHVNISPPGFPIAPPVISASYQLTPVDNGVVDLGDGVTATQIGVRGRDFTGADADVNFILTIVGAP